MNAYELYREFLNRRVQHPARLPPGLTQDILFIVVLGFLSLYFSPLLSPSIEPTMFRQYYAAVTAGDSAAAEQQEKVLSGIFARFKVVDISNTPFARYAWAGMFSGNGDIALVCLSLSFQDALASRFVNVGVVMLTAVFFCSFLLVEFSTGTHNAYTAVLNLHNRPTRSWFVYTLAEYRRNAVNRRFGVTFQTYVNGLLAFLPISIIGFCISSILGDFDLFFSRPLVSPLLLFLAFYVFLCVGGVVVYVFQRFIVYVFLRADIDVVRFHIEESTCAVCGFLVNTYVFQNNFVSTVIMTTSVLVFALSTRGITART